MIPYEDWEKVYEDSDFEFRENPLDIGGYGMKVKQTENLMTFPRETLKQVSEQNRDSAKRTLMNLFPNNFIDEKIYGTNLTYDSVIAAATKTHFIEEEKFRNSL